MCQRRGQRVHFSMCCYRSHPKSREHSRKISLDTIAIHDELKMSRHQKLFCVLTGHVNSQKGTMHSPNYALLHKWYLPKKQTNRKKL